jgi:hypothetical protein
MKSTIIHCILALLFMMSECSLSAQYQNYWKEKVYQKDSMWTMIVWMDNTGSFYGGGGMDPYRSKTSKFYRSDDCLESFDTTVFAPDIEKLDFVCDAQNGMWSTDNDSRVWHSTDEGKTWKVEADFLAQYGMLGFNRCMRVGNDGVLYVFYDASDIMRSTDKGKSWDYVIHPSGGTGWWYRPSTDLRINSRGDMFLLMCVSGSMGNMGFYRSTDNGVTWSRLDTLISVPRLYNDDRIRYESAGIQLIDDIPYLQLSQEVRVGFETESWDYMFKPRPDWSGMDTVSVNGVMFGETTVTDTSGRWYSSITDMRNERVDRRYLRFGFAVSSDSGRKWKILTATREDGDFAPRDIVDPMYGDTLQTVYDNDSQLMWIMPNGHILWCSARGGYNISTFRLPTPPRAFGIERACSTHTVTFVSDTLLDVSVNMSPAWAGIANIEELRKGRARRVVVTALDPETTLHFTITARGAMGTRVYRDSLVRHYTPNFRVINDSIYVDAGAKAYYRWLRNDTILWLQISPSLKMTEPGVYWCEVFDTTQCSHKKIGVTAYKLTNVKDGDTATDNLVVYPNPSFGILHVQCKESDPARFPEEFVIRDMLGKMLLRSNERDIDIGSLAMGMYIIEQKIGSHIRARSRFVKGE